MHFLPFENYAIQTTKTKEEILKILRTNTKAGNLYIQKYAKRRGKIYWGKIGEDNFKISPIIWYRNNFVPIIIGNIAERKDRTTVNINMRLHKGVFAILVLSMFAGLLFIIPFAMGVVTTKLAILVPIGLILFLYSIMFFGFWLEVKKRKPQLNQILNGTICEKEKMRKEK